MSIVRFGGMALLSAEFLEFCERRFLRSSLPDLIKMFSLVPGMRSRMMKRSYLGEVLNLKRL